jgi:hypothetical protein
VPVETFAVNNFETTLAENVGGRYLSEAHVTQFRLVHGLGSEVSVRRPLQRRRRVQTFAVHYFETTLAENVDGRSLPRAFVIGMGLLEGVVLDVPDRRHI